MAFIITTNRRRVIMLMVAVGLVVAAIGAAGVFTGPRRHGRHRCRTLALQLTFAAFYLVFQFGILMWFLSRPRKYTVTPDDAQIAMRFENYRGQPDLLEHAKSTVRILQGVKEFEHRGGEMPKGLLLSGRPGTGKTFLAACIASEANLPFIYIDASSIRGMFMGMTEMMVMKLFRDARGLARKYAEKGKRGVCIVFMDEIDSIGMNRGGTAGRHGHGHGHDGHDGRQQRPQHPAQPDGLAGRVRRGPLEPQDPALARASSAARSRTSRSSSSSARPTVPKCSIRR